MCDLRKQSAKLLSRTRRNWTKYLKLVTNIDELQSGQNNSFKMHNPSKYTPRICGNVQLQVCKNK